MQEIDNGLIISLDDVEHIGNGILRDKGFSTELAQAIAERLKLAHRDGPESHGLAMLPLYIATQAAGTVNLTPNPGWQAARPGLLLVNCDNSFAPYAINGARKDFIEMVKKQGIASLVTQNAHHIGALRHDVLALAEQGLIAIMMAGSRPWVIPEGGERSVFGTNPMAFACPRPDDEPMVWDQAVSMIAISDIRLAEKEGRQLAQPTGLNSGGEPSTDPAELIEAKRLYTYGAHKGSSIALMIEILSAGFSGGQFAASYAKGAQTDPTNPTGQTIIAIDPEAAAPGFASRIAFLLEAIADNGSARIPGDGRFARARKAKIEGVTIPLWLVTDLQELGWSGP